jgi:hypothetical protein
LTDEKTEISFRRRMAGDDVIPLSRFRAQLARARRGGRAEALLSAPDPAALVPTLPIQDLYFAIKEVGLADATDLVALATPAQVRGFIDLDAWDRDQLDEAKMEEWLNAVAEAGPVKLKQVVEALDPEVVALFLRRVARVFDLTLEDDLPEEPEGHFWPTPDGNFLLDVIPSGDRGKAVERIVDYLYRADLQVARWALMAARSEISAELEEWSYRWRSGRMADLGYVDYYDALSVYSPLDAARVAVEDTASAVAPPTTPAAPPTPEAEPALPTQLAAMIDPRGTYGRALATIDDPAELERQQALLMLLVNKVLSADRVETGDLEGAQKTLPRVVGTLDLGLEALLRARPRTPDDPDSDDARAGRLLRRVALEHIFRVGVGLLDRLQRAARALLTHGLVLVPPLTVSLAEPPHDALLAGLALRRPLYPIALDKNPPPDKGAPPLRPFSSLADVARATAALDELAQMGAFVFVALGIDREALARAVREAGPLLRPGRAETPPLPGAPPPPQVRFGTLVRTLACRALVDDAARLRGFTARERRALAERLGPGPLSPEARAHVDRAFAALLAAHNHAAPPWLPSRLDAWLADLGTRVLAPDGVLPRFSWLR